MILAGHVGKKTANAAVEKRLEFDSRRGQTECPPPKCRVLPRRRVAGRRSITSGFWMRERAYRRPTRQRGPAGRRPA